MYVPKNTDSFVWPHRCIDKKINYRESGSKHYETISSSIGRRSQHNLTRKYTPSPDAKVHEAIISQIVKNSGQIPSFWLFKKHEKVDANKHGRVLWSNMTPFLAAAFLLLQLLCRVLATGKSFSILPSTELEIKPRWSKNHWLSHTAKILELILVNYSVAVECGQEPPSGYVKYPADNVAYKHHEDHVTWQEARNRCIAEGADLAVAITPQQIERVQSRGGWFTWIGIHRPTGDLGNSIRVDTGKSCLNPVRLHARCGPIWYRIKTFVRPIRPARNIFIMVFRRQERQRQVRHGVLVWH